MLRPHIGLLRFSETIKQNSKYIRENIEIFYPEAILKFLQKSEAIEMHLQLVNQKDIYQTGKILFTIFSFFFFFVRDRTINFETFPLLYVKKQRGT